MSTPRNNGPGPSWRRHIARVGAAIGIAALAGATGLTGCTDASSTAPQAPHPSPTEGLRSAATLGAVTLGAPTLLNALTWGQPVTQATAGAAIGPEGGTFGIPGGIQVYVPAGAVATTTNFSVTRLPGAVVAYDFQPHGTTFAQPLVVVQPTAGTAIAHVPRNVTLTGAYFPDAGSLDQLLGQVMVTELRPTFVPGDRTSLAFSVAHFSGYVVAWGR